MTGKLWNSRAGVRRLLKLDLWLCLLFGATVPVLFIANEDPFIRVILCERLNVACVQAPHAQAYYKIAYDIAVGIIVSLFLYVLVVRIPERVKRARIKSSFRKRYNLVRVDCIAQFLLAADGTYTVGEPERLLSQDAFRTYFKEQVGGGQDRWDAFFNRVSDDALQEIIRLLEILRDEVIFVLMKTDIENQEVFEFLKRLSGAITVNKMHQIDYSSKERLTKFLWVLFTGWNFATGYPERDIVEEMIDKI